ncbi:DPP IV N-terminal domain-containing protein [Oceanobacillus sp. Castelsardo]|uniref:DPP IV N-terminal domain-containing protein n=1 Tax=Oceanobacillus sp. Castelsardo TaxID=1851204 RepID=UPI00083997EF|nr:DPP IV N-terminal domain-containing protein [Oceanobacillus sp. Castelsardo]
MKRKRIFLVTISVIFVLFVGTVLYAILKDDDAYRYYTGLGEKISVAPDDSKIAFSYYVDGNESIYTANPDGTHVKQITNSTNQQDHHPKYSPDGKKLVYVSKDAEGIQMLRGINEDGSEGRQLTDSDIHVTDVIFSPDGEIVYFVAIEAEEFKKGERSREGFDLYSIEADGSHMKKLTDTDHFSMNHLTLSPDGSAIYYSEFDGVEERIYSYSPEEGTVNTKPSILSKKIENAQSFYEPQLSSDGRYLVFTEVSKESEESSLFKYDLFLLDLKTQNVERLTDLKTAVTSPTFFHKENKIAFLENTNWPGNPAEYQLMTIDTTTHNIEVVKLDAPQSAGGNRLIQMLDRGVNGLTIAILYMVLFGLLSVYLHYYHKSKAYLPSIVSFAIAILTVVAGFVVGRMVDPWYGIGLWMLAVGIFGCSIVVVLFVFIFKRFAKK